MKAHECVSFLMLEGNDVLLEKRRDDKGTDPGLITLPGGHIEVGESQSEALFREVLEELNVTPTHYNFLCSLYHPTNELQLIHYYVVTRWAGEICAQEAEEVQWVPLASARVDIESDRLALAEVERVSRFL